MTWEKRMGKIPWSKEIISVGAHGICRHRMTGSDVCWGRMWVTLTSHLGESLWFLGLIAMEFVKKKTRVGKPHGNWIFSENITKFNRPCTILGTNMWLLLGNWPQNRFWYVGEWCNPRDFLFIATPRIRSLLPYFLKIFVIFHTFMSDSCLREFAYSCVYGKYTLRTSEG